MLGNPACKEGTPCFRGHHQNGYSQTQGCLGSLQHPRHASSWLKTETFQGLIGWAMSMGAQTLCDKLHGGEKTNESS